MPQWRCVSVSCIQKQSHSWVSKGQSKCFVSSVLGKKRKNLHLMRSYLAFLIWFYPGEKTGSRGWVSGLLN